MKDTIELSPWAFQRILDSKHIVATKDLKLYDVKLVKCGKYTQVYLYQNKKSKKISSRDKTEFNLNKLDLENNLSFKSNEVKTYSNNIELRSINRSKLECQRIAKTNFNDWETFITLTFEENITNLDLANKKFKYFIDKVRRVKRDFKYLCIPEFQKRGAVHYHLLTNLKCNSDIIPRRPTKKLYNPSSKTWRQLEFYDIKYWLNGYSSAEPLNGDIKKVVGYISKYMTKDIDNRLFNRHRYFYSRNLITPKESFINLDDKNDLEFYKKIIQDNNLIYHNSYENPYDNTMVTFLEYLNN